MDFDPEIEWYFSTLADLAPRIGNRWTVVMCTGHPDPSTIDDVQWYVVPYDGDIEQEEDLSVVEKNPDKIILKLRQGVLFSYPSETLLSRWASSKLKRMPELAGRVI